MSEAGMIAPEFSLIVSTIGRPSTFLRLLSSLAEEWVSGARFELIVVDQDPSLQSLAILEAEPRLFPWRHMTSDVGVSLGRNTGLVVAHGDIIGFPDDDAWYSGRTLAGVRTAFAALPCAAGVSGCLATREGEPHMLRWLRKPAWITPRNHHRTSIGVTLFYRRGALESAGNFDEAMGAGSRGWYGAGEESDLLLRVLRLGGSVRYMPTITVHHDPISSDTQGLRGKMLLYGAGQGYLWRKHALPKWHISGLLMRKVAKVALLTVRGERQQALLDLGWTYGAICGLLGRMPRGLQGRA